VELARLYLKSNDPSIHDDRPSQSHIWKAVELLNQAIEESNGQDLSVLQIDAQAHAMLGLYDQAAELIQKILDHGKGLSGTQIEALRQVRLAYALHDMPDPVHTTAGEIDLTGLTVRHDDAPVLPELPMPPFSKILNSDFDLSTPPGPNSIFDERLYFPREVPSDPGSPPPVVFFHGDRP
jgi:hypothetical protein